VIETLDDAVGLLMNKLDDLGLRTNTIVIFTSDNGGLHVPEGGHTNITHNAPFRAGKGYLYEGGLRVPLIVRWPGKLPAGRVVDQPVMNTGWFATLFELAKLRAPEGLDGESFANFLTGGSGKSRPLFWHYPHYTNQGSRPGGAMRHGKWKLIEHYDTGRAELYNLESDPGEINDLAAKEPKRVADFRKRLAAWRVSVGAQTNELNPNFQPELWKALYETVDPTRYNAAEANDRTRAQILNWRKQMNAAVTKDGKRERTRQ